MKINEVVIDNREGWGATPNNDNVDYLGLRVMMKPSNFLRLARYISPAHLRNLDNFKEYLKQNGAIGAPWLDIRLPREWDNGDLSTPAIVVGHEGRHRMSAIKQVEGDIPVETHLFFGPNIRSRHLTPEMIKRLNEVMYDQDASYNYDTGKVRFPDISTPEKGPFFTISQ